VQRKPTTTARRLQGKRDDNLKKNLIGKRVSWEGTTREKVTTVTPKREKLRQGTDGKRLPKGKKKIKKNQGWGKDRTRIGKLPLHTGGNRKKTD